MPARSGCPLRCSWCDTEYAFNGGEMTTIATVLERVAAFSCPTVCVTGGEPLAQKACLPLLIALCDAGYSVSLETSGALDITEVDARVSRIVDLKALSDLPAFRSAVMEAVDRVNRQVTLTEKVRNITLTPDGFTIDNEMLTPSLKIRRHMIRQVYGEQIDALYRG